jgi:putative DNA primase/helicase
MSDNERFNYRPDAGAKKVAIYEYRDEAGQVLFEKLRYEPKSFRLRHKLDGRMVYNLDGVRRVPFRLPKVAAASTVVLCEGEKDCLNVSELGFCATTAPFGAANWPDELSACFKDKVVYVCYDVGQEAGALRAAASLHGQAKEVRVCRLPLTENEADVTDYLNTIPPDSPDRSAKQIKLVQELLRDAELYEYRDEDLKPAKTKARIKPAELPLSLSLTGVEARAVNWLWPNFIPLARATIVSGDPNVGKTWLVLDIAARLSRGLAWPDGTPGPEPANIIYLTVEDNPHDTIRPRIDSLGGDPARIFVLNPAYEDFISFAEHEGLKALEQEILRIGDVRLVVLDPVLDFSGKVNPNAAEQVRAFLSPLVHLAEKLNLALVLVAHLNKAQSQSAIYRTGGSTSAWLGKCRAAFMVFRDRDDKKKRYVSAIKSNLAPEDPPQLAFLPEFGRLIFEKVEDEVDMDEQLNPQLFPGAEKEETSFAVTWLRELLKDGPVDLKEILKAARESGVSRATVFRARTRLALVARIENVGRSRSSSWELPKKAEGT